MSGEAPWPVSEEDRQKAVEVALLSHRLLADRLGRDLYDVPAFDMLVDLYLLEERRPRSLTSLCGASNAPVRTALRTINRMVDRGLVIRLPDPNDARRTNVALTSSGIALLDSYFEALLAGILRSRP